MKKKTRKIIVTPGKGKFSTKEIKAAVLKIKAMTDEEKQEALSKISNKVVHIDTLVKELSLDHELAAVNQNYKEAKMKGWKRDLLVAGTMIGLVALFGTMFYLVSLI